MTMTKALRKVQLHESARRYRCIAKQVVVDCLATGGRFRIERFALEKGRAIPVFSLLP